MAFRHFQQPYGHAFFRFRTGFRLFLYETSVLSQSVQDLLIFCTEYSGFAFPYSFGLILPSKCDRLLLRAPVPPDFFSCFSPNGREINHFSAAKGSLAENRSFFRPNVKQNAVSPKNQRYFGRLAQNVRKSACFSAARSQ